MLHVQICCNDQNGLFTGRATRVDFNEYELTVEDSLWPPVGVKVQFTDTRVKFGRDIWRPTPGLGGYGGNIFWRGLRMSGIDCIGLMNYLMTLKHWRADAGECYLFDQFNSKQPIDPRAFFRSRHKQTYGGPGLTKFDEL